MKGMYLLTYRPCAINTQTQIVTASSNISKYSEVPNRRADPNKGAGSTFSEIY